MIRTLFTEVCCSLKNDISNSDHVALCDWMTVYNKMQRNDHGMIQVPVIAQAGHKKNQNSHCT
jgi:hypothetical protein